MKKIVLLAFSLAIASASYSQKESSFSAAGSGVATAFLSDYQCLGINAANLGFTRDSSKFHLSLLEFGASVYSDALQKKEIKQQFIFSNEPQFTHDEKIAAAEEFANSKFVVNLDVAWLSAAFQTEKFGGLAFTVRERTTFNSFFNKDFAQIVFEGYNAPYFDSLIVNGTDTTGYAKIPKTLGELANGSKISGTWYREYVLGYGRKFISGDKFSLYAGGAVKYLAGYGILDIKSEDNVLSGFSALSPFLKVNYSNSTPSEIAGEAMKTVGSGFAFDLGATVELYKKLRLSAALNDIGSLKWDGNVYEAQDSLVNMVKNSGFSNFDMIKQVKGLIMDSTIFTWKGMESKSMALPTNMRLGINYQFAFRSNIGADVYVPVNNNAGSFNKAIIGIGANVTFFKMITLSGGFSTGGNSAFVVPLGITFTSKDGSWQMGVASRDALTFIKKDNPTISIAFGFFKMNIGKYTKPVS
jgi:hypothetical protein